MLRRPLIFTLLLLALVARGDEPPSPKVLERYRQMLEKNPGEGTALDRLWKAYLDQNQTAELLGEYQAGGTFSSELILGHLLKKAARNDEALAAFERAAKLDEKNPLAPLATARLRGELGQNREAAEAYEKAAALLPPDDARLPETLLQLGTAWLAAGDKAKAADAWERTVALNPADLELHRRLAETYAQNGLTDRAIGHLEYLEKNAPPAERALALQQLARLQQAAGNQDAAIAALEKALALTAPGNWLRAELTSQLIRLHQRYHRTAELEERWKKFAAANPRDLGACLQLVDLYERLGELEEQRTWLGAAIKLAPKNPDYRLKLARLDTRTDQLDAAAELYDKLLAEQPTNTDFVFERAQLDLLRDAAPAARQRIAALLAAKKNDEAVRAKALEFYQQHRLFDLVEERLNADAASGDEEAIVALGNFLFTQHREAESKRAFQRLIVAADPPAKRAAAHFRLAQIFKAENDFTMANTELAEAVALQPDSREFQLTLGELATARADYPAAQAAFAKAVQVSKTDADRDQADQRLFQSLHNLVPAPDERESPSRPLILGPTTPTLPPPENPQANVALDQQFTTLAQEAAAAGTEAGWLRLARWRLWNRETKAALDATQKALDLNPKSAAAQEILVQIHTMAGPSPVAVFDLLRLAEVDPANRASYQRRAGQLELQAGRVTEALAIFERLAKASPGNLEALTDLALTQQRAELWTDALASWRQAYALSPVSRKKESLTPLLLTLEHLGLHQQSAELQLKAVETEADQHQQFALFGDLLAHCAKHGLLDWLRAQFEQRRKGHADDYFTEMALGRILKAAGDRAAAFEVLADASFAAENSAEALPELIREAEDLRKLDTAVQLQERFLRIVPQDKPEGFEKLAQLQERNFDIEGATRTWDRLLTRFPRDPEPLGLAIEFQLKWGAPARAAELLRKARALDPANAKTLATLADLDLDLGETKEAAACLEQILHTTAPEKAGDPLRFPASRPAESGRLQTSYLATVGQRNARPTAAALRALRSFWVEDPKEVTTEQDQRLSAIRQLAQIVATKGDTAELAAWTKRWQALPDAPSETLWALFYAGAAEATLDRIEALMAALPKDERIPQAFIWLAFQTQKYPRLSAWLRDRRRTASERDYLSVALDQYLEQNPGRSDPGLLETLYPPGSHLRLWQAATLFAGRNRFHEAAQLGQRFFDSAASQRGMCGEELARWYLFDGQTEQARGVLRETIKLPADSLASPVLDALHDYWLLLPESARPAFVESYLGGLDNQAAPVHAAAAAVLLRGLAGDDAAARAAVDRLIELRPLIGLEYDDTGTSATRRWRFLLQAGMQLQTWRLERLSIYLWEKALGDDALVQLQGEAVQVIVREMRQQLCVFHLAYDPPGDAPQWIENYARLSSRDDSSSGGQRRVAQDDLASLGAALSGLNANVPAVAVARLIWERNLGSREPLINLLNACRAAGDEDTAEEVLWTSLGDGPQRLGDLDRREFIVQLADLLDRQGGSEQARLLLSDTLHSFPNDTRVLMRLAQFDERAARPADAEAIYRRLLSLEPGNASARLALSAILEKAGRLPEAIALFPTGTPPEGAARLALLLVKNRQPEEAIAALESIPPGQQIPAALTLADALAAGDERRLARSMILGVLSRTTDAKLEFPLQLKMVELLTPEDGAPVALRELRRLRQLAGNGAEDLFGSYLDAAARQSARLGVAKEFAHELAGLWAEGVGPVPAGVTILTTQLEAGEHKAAEATLTEILAREDTPAPWLLRAADALEAAKLSGPFLRVLERLAALNPLDEQPVLRLARTLQALGRHDAALAALEPLAARAVVSDDLAGKIAHAFAELGDEPRALQLYAEAVHRDPLGRNTEVLLEAARHQLAAHDLRAAKATLRTAFANPANRHFDAIIDWLVAAEKMERFDAAAGDFGLSTPRLLALRRELFTYFDRGSRSAPALALFEAHPEIWRPGMAARLREMARDESGFGPVAALLEKILAQSGETPDLSLALARIYGDWAASELQAGQPDAALGHLRKAREHRPDVADFAFRLSALQTQQGDRRGAIQTLQTFLALTRDPVEIAQAREQLAKLRPGG